MFNDWPMWALVGVEDAARKAWEMLLLMER